MPPWLPRAQAWLSERTASRTKLRFEEQAQHPDDVQRALLLAVLRRNQHTRFGKEYDLASLRDADAFRRRVPLHTDDMLRDMLSAMEAQEPLVLTSDAVARMNLRPTSGGVRRSVPITHRQVHQASEAWDKLVPGFLLAALGHRPPARGGVAIRSWQSAVVSPLGPLRYGGTQVAARTPHGLHTPPVRQALSSPHALMDALYLCWLLGLQRELLTHLVAPTALDLMHFFHVLEQRAGELIYDLRTGSLRAKLQLPPALLSSLQSLLTPQPVLARHLTDELSRGPVGLISRMFPQLDHVVVMASSGADQVHSLLHRALGPVPIYTGLAALPESLLGVGVGLQEGPPRFALHPEAAYFEFIPEGSQGLSAPTVLTMADLPETGRFEVVVTTPSGLCRYRTGSFIEVVGRYQKLPLFVFAPRPGDLLNLCGEHTSESDAYTTLLRVIGRAGLHLVDFTTRIEASEVPQCYVLYLELSSEHSQSEAGPLADWMDAALRQTNPLYDEARAAAQMGPLHVRVVEGGTFLRLREVFIVRGIPPALVKIPRLLGDPELLRVLHRKPA